MDALMDNRVVDAAEISEEIHLWVYHDGSTGDAHLDGFAFAGVKHLRRRFHEVYLTEDGCVFPDSLRKDGEF